MPSARRGRSNNRGQWTGCPSATAADLLTVATFARSQAGAALEGLGAGTGRAQAAVARPKSLSAGMSAPSELARAVIRFWCDELTSEQHFKKDPALDRHIAERFGKLREEVLRSNAAGWRDSPETMAAAIILLDQFSRNMFRGSAKAFEADPLALELCKEALAKGWVDEVARPLPSFMLMPLQHSEKLEDQERSVDEFRDRDPLNYKYALLHRDQIRKFGRFPGRNAALGRVTTPEERSAIDRGETF